MERLLGIPILLLCALGFAMGFHAIRTSRWEATRTIVGGEARWSGALFIALAALGTLWGLSVLLGRTRRT